MQWCCILRVHRHGESPLCLRVCRECGGDVPESAAGVRGRCASRFKRECRVTVLESVSRAQSHCA